MDGVYVVVFFVGGVVFGLLLQVVVTSKEWAQDKADLNDWMATAHDLYADYDEQSRLAAEYLEEVNRLKDMIADGESWKLGGE